MFFYEYFKIPRYQDLLASKFDEAIKFLGGVHQVTDNYDKLVNQLSRLERVHECQQKLHQIYMNDFEDFIKKLSPATHYNISVLFDKISVNIGNALNYASTALTTKLVTTQKQLTN